MAAPALDAFLPAALRGFLFQIRSLERQIRGRLSPDGLSPDVLSRDGLSRDGLSRDVLSPDGLTRDVAASSRPTPAAEYRRRLAEHLEAHSADALARGRDPQSLPFQQAQHLMATLADATFQAFDWWGRKTWLEQPLASDFPPPAGVDEELSQQVDQLLASDRPDAELAQFYLLALASGAFSELDTADTRRRLLAALGEPFPELLEEPERVFPDAYRRRQRRGPAALLPAVRVWLVAVLALGVVLLAVSAPLWLDATAAARQAVQQILSPQQAGD